MGPDHAASRDERVRDALRARAPRWGLDPGRLRVEYVLNPGGFVNRSFRVSDGRRRLHLKLADDPRRIERLRRWRGVRDLLEERYRAPAMLDWVAVPGTPLEGPLFEFVPGAAPARLSAALLAALAPVLRRLHADRELAGRLPRGEGEVPCRDTFRGTFLRRLRANLEMIGRDRPPFVPEGTLDWMRGEVDALEARVEAAEAFDRRASSPVHGDLWLENLRVADGGGWWILDWDDLGIGDPALDWAILLGPTRRDPGGAGSRALPGGLGEEDPLLPERLALYARASLLDWVVDPLADWLEADAAPGHAGAARREKRRIHRGALARYRELYPGP